MMHIPSRKLSHCFHKENAKTLSSMQLIKSMAKAAQFQKLKYNNGLAHDESFQMSEFSCTTVE